MLNEYGIQLSSEGDGAARGFCPWHPDENPSFRVFFNDQGLRKWHCYPCDVGGDVFDLIQRLDGVGFYPALRKAHDLLQQLPDGYVAQVQQNEANVTTRDDAVLQARAYAKADPAAVAHSAFGIPDRAADQAHRIGDYAIRFWGWGYQPPGSAFVLNDGQVVEGDMGYGTVLMPHYDRNRQLTGVKGRKHRGARFALRPSKFNDLYGAWRPRPHNAYLICEGETDTVWAAERCDRQSIPINVLGLPAGAMDDFDPAWAELLRGATTIFLAFDADSAGEQATAAWLSALAAGGFDDVRVCRLPEGLDLRGARPDIARLLQEATRPKPNDTDIIPWQGGYARPVKDGTPRILASGWYLEPKTQLTPGDDEDRIGPGLKVNLHSQGVVREDFISAEALRTKNGMTRWASERALVWHGSDVDTALLAQVLYAQASIMPEAFQSSRVGVHRAPKRYQWGGPALVTPDPTVRRAGRLPWTYVPWGQTIAPNVHLEDGSFDFRWLADFVKLGPTELTTPLLGWLIASARRDEVTNFPIMYIGGPSGSGKSTIAKLACRLMGSSIETNLAQTTAFILMNQLSASTTLPVFLDEYTLMSKRDALEELRGNIPQIYEGGTGRRGRQDQTQVLYRMTAPVLIAGEDVFTKTREVERMIAVEASRTNRDSDALARLYDKPIHHFAMALYRWLLSAEPGDLPLMPEFGHDRTTYNRAVVDAGWATLDAFLTFVQMQGLAVPELPEAVNWTTVDAQAAQVENSYEDALHAIYAAQDSHGIQAVVPGPTGTYVQKSLFKQAAERCIGSGAVPGNGDAMLRYFASQGKTLEPDQRVRLPNGKRPRMTLIHDFFVADPSDADSPDRPDAPDWM